jgi:cysteinyl-tRNA synthetase
MSRELTKNQLIKVSGAILSSYVNNYYLEETKHCGVFRQSTKKNVSRTLEDLLKIELEYFDNVYDIDDKEVGGALVQTNLKFIDEFLKFDFNEFSKLQEIFVAFTKDKKRLTSISDKILIKSGAKKI